MVRFKTLALVLLSCMFLMASAALAADAAKKPVIGKVKSVADDKTSFVVTPKQGDDVTVKVNADTKYKLGEDASTFAEVVKVDARVKATLNADGVATEVVAHVKKAKNG
ncbi:MAG: hypothetical protein WCI73_11875 [Phycisphaerae bacterium]